MDQLLTLLSADARLTNAQLAAALSISEEEVAARIADYEERKIIKGYKAIVDWDKTDRDYVNARIELKVTPQKGMGFEEIAGIALTVTGKTFKDVAMFVAHRLAPLDSVQSTSTSFVLRTYKELGVFVSFDEMDEREVATL